MIGLKEMENRGYEKEDRTAPDEKIHATAPSELQAVCLPRGTDCPCVESQKECTCSKGQRETSRVELKTWVKPKGLLLAGLAVALVAWCTIYFTLSAFQLL